MGFSVGLFEDFDAEALISRSHRSVTSLARRCSRVAIWHEPVDGWRTALVEALIGGPLAHLSPRHAAKLGRRQVEPQTSNPIETFLEWTEPALAVHDRHLLVLRGEAATAVLLTDVDGVALDVLLEGRASSHLGRAVAAAAWDHLFRGA